MAASFLSFLLGPGNMNKKTEQCKKVLILYTGGTIGMKPNAEGKLVPAPGALAEKIKSMPELHSDQAAEKLKGQGVCTDFAFAQQYRGCLFGYDLEEYDPLLDSSNVAHDVWIRLAEDIEKNYDKYEGFVILHGTDTMTYTASALSFMLENLGKPVILTGAMTSIFDIRSDAPVNLINALIIAACHKIPEVSIFCGNRLLRGNRSVKTSSVDITAFESPRHGNLVDAESSITVNKKNIRRCPELPPAFHTRLAREVVVIEFFPGITTGHLGCTIKLPVKGVIISCFGTGNIPYNPGILNVFKRAADQGIIVVRVTQCHHGTVSNEYQQKSVLENVNVLSGYDMTVEAAYTKLCYVLGRDDWNCATKRMVMEKNLRGELTLPNQDGLCRCSKREALPTPEGLPMPEGSFQGSLPRYTPSIHSYGSTNTNLNSYCSD